VYCTCDSLLVVDHRRRRRSRSRGAERRNGMQLMELKIGNVCRDYLVPVEARDYVFGFWRRHDCTSWTYYMNGPLRLEGWKVGRGDCWVGEKMSCVIGKRME